MLAEASSNIMDVPMRLVLFALTAEATGAIEYLDAKADLSSQRLIWKEGKVPTIYHFQGGTIVITDIGLHAAAAAVARYGPSHTEIWNIGFAGTLTNKFSLLELVLISKVSKYCPYPYRDAHINHILTHSLPTISMNIGEFGKTSEDVEATPNTLFTNSGALITSDVPIHESCIRNDLILEGHDLVDMEGYAIAHLAKSLGIPCVLWKIVSDFSQPGGPDLIRRNQAYLAEKIVQLFK